MEGKAQEWFTSLPNGTIESYTKLIQKFMFHFASKRKARRWPFASALARDTPTDVEQLMQLAQKYIDEEQMNAMKDVEWKNRRGATYQRLVNRMFKDLNGKTMEVYVDDMLIKAKEEKEHLAHLLATFKVMRIEFGSSERRGRTFESSLSLKQNATRCGKEVHPDREISFGVGEQEEQMREEGWMLYVHGSSTSNAGGAGILLTNAEIEG
ncbi:UNVERIFIED_CONTAM: hypothetical protein Scaly_2715700 [Sesamum calycinum]|uniref:Retrotransposon gag domain-containing protein n=1 Tax=Sesamum calycinum TaxID=2727403 RepID=A0AAW2J5D5_9LAMI